MTIPRKSAPAAKKTGGAAKPATRPARATARPAVKSEPASAVKTTPKPVAKALELAAKPTAAKAPKAAKPDKPKKPKLVRDSFTIPKSEYLVLDELKQRAARLGHPVKKTELLRAGIKALASLPDAGFLAAAQAVPAIKTGRPKASPEKAVA